MNEVVAIVGGTGSLGCVLAWRLARLRVVIGSRTTAGAGLRITGHLRPLD